MSDAFREVDEALREDRAKALWRRYGAIALTTVALVIAAAAAWVWWQDQRESRAAAETASLLQRSAMGDVGLLADLSQNATPGVAMLARFRAAHAAAATGNVADAVGWYEGLANNDDLPAVWRDYAAFMGAWLTLDDGDPAALRAVLEPLSADGQPLRFSAREALALLALREGRSVDAAALFADLAESEETPPAIFRRAQELADYLAAEGGPG